MHRLTLCGVLALIAGGFSDVNAAPYLVDDTFASLTGSGGVYTITLASNAPATTPLEVRFTGDEEAVDELRVVTLNNPNSRVRLTVRGIVNPSGAFSLGVIESISRTNGTGELWLDLVHANQVGEIVRDPMASNYADRAGTIVANRIGTIHANRAIVADRIQATGSNWPGADNTDIATIKTETINDVGFFFALDGVILSDIVTSDGDIDEINAAGYIGSLSAGYTQLISTRGPTSTGSGSGGDIGTIQSAAGFGKLLVNTGLGGSDGTVNLIRATDGGWGYDEVIDVDLEDLFLCSDGMGGMIPCTYPGLPNERSEGGQLITRKLNILELNGSFDTTIDVSLASTSNWKIGASLGPNTYIKLPEYGLKNQITINAADDLGTWDEDAIIRVTKPSNLWQDPQVPEYYLLSEEYAETPTQLGGTDPFSGAVLGGAVGLAGYAAYASASQGPIGGSMFIGSIDPNSLEVDPPCVMKTFEFRTAFYGNVTAVNGVDLLQVVTLERLPFGGADPLDWETVTLGSVFTSGRNLVMKLPQAYVNGRWVDVSFEPGYVYEVSIPSGTLRVNPSDQIDSLDVIPIAARTYQFEALNGCESLFDLNSDGFVDQNDTMTWFSQPVDLNLDPAINGDDMMTLIRGISEHGN